jgi:hypothetical protein
LDEFALSGAPWLFDVTDVVPAAVAELIGVPPDIVEPASTGIEGSIILIKVLTEGLGLV